jgi:hypothetical protein
MFQLQPPMSSDRTAHLLDRVIYDKVHDLIDHGKLNELEEQLAISLSLLPGVTDAEMLAGARAAIGRALRELAHAIEHPPTRAPEHHIRYLNAICAEVDPGPRDRPPA